MSPSKIPPEWLEQVPAQVFGCMTPGEIRIVVLPGAGDICWDIPLSSVPFDLRMPNTPLWVRLDESINVIRVWRREKQ
jgi:hypothetical protein